MRWNGRRASAEVVQGHEGLAILIRQPSATNTPSLRYGLIAAPQHIGFYSGSQRSKLTGKTMGGQVQSHLAITGNPMNDNARGCLSMGVGWRTGSGRAPYSLLLDLAPVAFVAGAHPQEGVCRIEEGILSVRSQAEADLAFEMTAEAATGRLLTWRVSARTNDAWLVLRCQEGAFARALREVATGGAAFTNAIDPQRPWSSSLAMLGRDFHETVEKDLPEIFDWLGEGVPGNLNAKDWLDAVTLLEEMPWRELLAPLDFSTRAPSEPDSDEDFPFVLEEPLPGLEASSDWVRLLGGLVMKANDTLWPRGSWPWAVMRDAVFLAAGEARWATNDMARLTKANDTGPLGYLLAAHALGSFDPRLAVTFSQQGAASTTPAALQDDLRLLLRGEEAGQKFLRGTLQRAPAFNVQNLQAFMRLIGTNALPVVLDGFATMSTSSNLPPDEALRPVVERHWEKEIRPWLLTAFANLCLTGYQATSPHADASQAAAAAGWLLEAAELGHTPAQMLLGRLYTHGLGVTANPATAAMWMRKAAERGYPHAACELGRLYAKLGNQDEAARWFRIGAQDNCPGSEIGLAQLLLGTSGMTREQQEEGLGLLRKASEHGSVEAQFYLGMVYEQRKQIEEAVNYYREAAVKGLVQAQMKLAELLTDGFSMKPDFVEAWVWCKQAAAQGNRLAAAQVRSVERKLTVEQMEDARRRLRQIENAPRTEGPGRERSGN